MISSLDKASELQISDYSLERYSGNPIITVEDFPSAMAVFNCGQVMMGQETILLLSVVHRKGRYRGVAGATTHVARSTDGLHFSINSVPFLQRPEALEMEPFSTLDCHPIDTRVTAIDGVYYIIHPACGPWGTLGILGKTEDFTSYEYMEVVSLPDNRVPCLFPEKNNGRYMRLDRPYRVAPNEFHTDGNIWLSSSPDLIFWGMHRPLLRAGFANWARTKIGPTPPIRTEEGWLVIIHGVSHNCGGFYYSLGAMLLDIEDPAKIRGVTKAPILYPQESYEYNGMVQNVVFTCGAIADIQQDLLRVYYGAADTCICLATGSVRELVNVCLADGVVVE